MQGKSKALLAYHITMYSFFLNTFSAFTPFPSTKHKFELNIWGGILCHLAFKAIFQRVFLKFEVGQGCLFCCIVCFGEVYQHLNARNYHKKY